MTHYTWIGAVCPDLKGHNLETLDKKLTYQYGEEAYLKCKAGYKLFGQEFLTCDQSGQWNETIPSCGGLFVIWIHISSL